MNADVLRQSLLEFSKASFSRSGGPGGQNVNKLNTKVTLKVRLSDLAGLRDAELERVKLILASRISSEGELVIASSEERSRQVNLQRAYFRMEALICGAARLPKRRIATVTPKAAREKRLKMKKRNSEQKSQRKKPGASWPHSDDAD
ncbi:MAG: aminoacyl-tRNA hydrolase [Spirochaetes bacterium]|nr:aminoacyl-tRNA hydrolase [Spirochaetota bacterium]